MEDETKVKRTSGSKSRKRVADPHNTKRSIEKKARYTEKGPAKMPSCKHTLGAFQCHSLSSRDVDTFRKRFYASSEKVAQDYFILKHCTTEKPKNSTDKSKKRQRKFSMHFYVTKAASTTNKVPVCRQTFLGILGIKKHRLHGVNSRYFKSGTSPKEGRGGDRKTMKYLERKENVNKFIETFKVSEKHYCRAHSKSRQYLPADLTVAAMYRLYNKTCIANELKVSKWFFTNIFNTEYNLGFGSPRVDTCSTCTELKLGIKKTKDLPAREKLILKLNIHGQKADAYFNKLREESDDLVTLSFDCEKNQALPKLSDQSAYYSRQLNLYNFTVVKGNSHVTLNKENVVSHYWIEGEHLKGSNEIASALFYTLNNLNLSTNITRIRLCCDGCPGQNKNTVMIGMLSYWLNNMAPEQIKIIELVFPVTGHSFIPPDRVFGAIEKEIKKKETIVNPEEYINVIGSHSKVYHLGHDYDIIDWKTYLKSILRNNASWHFKIGSCKRVLILKKPRIIEVRGEPFYTVEVNAFKSLTKKGKTFSQINLPIIISKITINPKKLKDVQKLLTSHFGANWKEDSNLSFYSSIMSNQQVDESDEESDSETNTELCCADDDGSDSEVDVRI